MFAKIVILNLLGFVCLKDRSFDKGEIVMANKIQCEPIYTWADDENSVTSEQINF